MYILLGWLIGIVIGGAIVFFLSYFKLVGEDFLKKYKHNLVVHESALPKGKGWSPLFWQILEGKNRIPIVLFEAEKNVDSGAIYLKDFIKLNGTELYEEIRFIQAEKTKQLCIKFLNNYNELILKKKSQKGKSSFYIKRSPVDSRLKLSKSIKTQFNLLRICDNENFPAYFNFKKAKYIVRVYKVKVNESKK